ncbi:MAG: hypothetical protein WB992_25135 [Bryobacteraceae bacterium]
MAKTKSPQATLSDMLEDIKRIASDPDYRDEEEEAPSSAAVNHLQSILEKAYKQFGDSLPRGEVSCFAGEMSVTWTLRDRKLRVDIASDGSPRMHFGSFESDLVNRYTHERPQQDERILARVDWLVQPSDAPTGCRAL